MTIWILALNWPVKAYDKQWQRGTDKGAHFSPDDPWRWRCNKSRLSGFHTCSGLCPPWLLSASTLGHSEEVAWKKVFWAWDVNRTRYLKGRQGRLSKPMEIKSPFCRFCRIWTGKQNSRSVPARLLRLCNTWFHYCLLASFGRCGSTSGI